MIMRWIVVAFSVCGFSLPLGAQDFPVKPIHIVISNAAGGATDVAARLIGPKLTEAFGQPVVLENRVAVGGVIAANEVARATADGHTLLMAFDSFVTNTFLFHGVKYDSVTDFAPVSLVAKWTQVLFAHPDMNVKSLREFVALAKEKGDKLSYGTAGPGSSSRMSFELFKEVAGIDTLAIHYRGGAPAINDLIGGRVQTMLIQGNATLQQSVKAGKLVALAVSSSARSSLWPGVPTIAETYPGFETGSWAGLLAPANTPRAIVEKLSAAVAKGLASAEMTEKFRVQGAEIVASSPEVFSKMIRTERAKWERVIREKKISID